jgi:chorismate synthase
MKPIATIGQGLPSVDLRTLSPERSQHERSDICAVAAASVVVENVCGFEIARVLREKFSGDSMREMRLQHEAFMQAARRL